jgi:hypothetical protein
MKRMNIYVMIVCIGVMILAANPASNIKIGVPLRFDHYYSYEMAVTALKALNRSFPHLTKLDQVGKSEEGRIIYCMTINNPKSGPELNKPGIYVDGNIHGNEIQATEVALYLINYLLTNYNQNNDIKDLVDRKCFYVVPMVNVDGRFHFFSEANTPNSNRGLRRPHDDDHDGLIDEDFPDDLDGDGNICTMRKRDPHGSFKTDPADARLMIRTKPGETGEWTILGSEGIDNDGDGKINEDAEGYVDPNRNWGFDWMPNYVQEGAGDYPFSGIGMKALADFIQKRPNICIAWAFHNYGGMFLRGPSTKTQQEYHPRDIAVYDYLGKQAERITPGYRYLISWKDLYNTYGDFGEWMSMIMGSYTFVGELYMNKQESFKSIKEGKKGKTDDDDEFSFQGSPELNRERLKFNDHLTQGERYKSWAPYKHPVYGDIEIGGWVKMSSRLPDPFMLIDLVHRNASAILYSAKNTPEVDLHIAEIKKLGSGITQIRTRLTNSKAIPTMSYHAQNVKLYCQDILRVSGKTIQVVAGGHLIDSFLNKVKYKTYRPDTQFLFIPGFGKIEHQFLVSGKGKVLINYTSRHGGKLKKVIDLK